MSWPNSGPSPEQCKEAAVTGGVLVSRTLREIPFGSRYELAGKWSTVYMYWRCL
jgi:hypothetical protein